MTYTQDLIGFWQRIRDIANTGNASMAAYGSDIFEILKSLRDLLNTSHLSTAAYPVNQLGMLQNIRDLLNTGNLSTAAYSNDVLGVTKNIRDLLNSGSASTGSYPAGYFGILQAACDFAVANGVGGAEPPAFLVGTSVHNGTSPFSTSAIDTTGATLIVVMACAYNPGQGANPVTITDNKGNTYTSLTFTNSGNNIGGSLWYTALPTVGSGHTITFTGDSFSSISVAAFSGTGALSFDHQSAFGGPILNSIQAGSITPSANNSLIVAGVAGAGSLTYAIDNGFTIAAQTDGDPATFSSGIAYLVQNAAAAINPTWTYIGTNQQLVASVVDFAAGAVGDVTVDAVGTQKYHSATTSFSDSTVITVGAGNALVVPVCFGFASTPPASISATWDGVPMTKLVSYSPAGRPTICIFGLRSPAAGAKTLALSWTNSAEIFVDAISFSGVNVTSDGTAFPHNATQDRVNATVPITSATGNYVLAAMTPNTDITTTGTTLFADNVHGSFINASACYDVGAATVNIGSGSSSVTTIAAIDINAGAAPAGDVTVDALGTEKYQLSSNNFTYTGLTISPGLTNPGLIVVLTRADDTNNVTTGVAASWGAQSMTLVSSSDSAGDGFRKGAYIFGLRNPMSGNQTLTISGTNSARDNMVNAISFSNVNQSSDAAAFPNATGGNNVTSIEVTSNAGHIAVGAFQTGGSVATIIGTTIFSDTSNGALVNAAADYVISSGSSTAVGSTSAQSCLAVVDVSN